MRILTTLLPALLLACGVPVQAAPIAKAVLIDTFDSPVYVTHAPGSNQLLFVVEQTGRVQVLENEVTQITPFLDVSGLISCCGERGLLSIAFAPNYATTGLFYIAFTNTNGDVEIDEYRRSAGDAKQADPASQRRVLVVRHRDAGNHNGGQLQFGPDGFLYISIGDGGATPEAAPNLRSLLGKILRIDPRQQGGNRYTIPHDNPYVGMMRRKKEIYAYGLRNPWRFSFDRNHIAIADVGQIRQEELNFLTIGDAKGVNFGWPEFEGNRAYDSAHPGPDPAKKPIYVYSHTHGRCAIIGGYVSHDPRIAAIKDRYLFGDLCDGRIFSLLPDAASQEVSHITYIGITATQLSSFGVGPQRMIYITQTTGELSRIDPF